MKRYRVTIIFCGDILDVQYVTASTEDEARILAAETDVLTMNPDFTYEVEELED